MATKHDTTGRRDRRPRGITLIETAIVLAVIAVVGALAAPSFRALVDARRLDGAATRLAADLQFVRGEAIARNQALRFGVQGIAGATCWIVHTGAAAACRCAAEAAPVCSDGARAIRSTVLPAAERVGVAANVASIVFDPLHGTSTPTGTLRLTDASGRAVHHVVNVVGRVRTCSPGGAVAGHPAC